MQEISARDQSCKRSVRHETKENSFQQVQEIQDIQAGKQSLDDINQRNLEAAGLAVHRGTVGMEAPQKKTSFLVRDIWETWTFQINFMYGKI